VEKIKKKVRTLSRRNPAYAELAEWMGRMLVQTAKAGDSLDPPRLELDDRRVEALAQGRSLCDPAEMDPDPDHAAALFESLLKEVEGSRLASGQASGLRRVLAERSNGAFGLLLRSALTGDEETLDEGARRFRVEPMVLTLLLRLSLRPYLLGLAAAARRAADLDRWTHGHCPVCGSAPILAELSGEGGARRLHCSLCETAWAFARLRCPFCENQEADDLGYLQAEEEPGLRVDYCCKCGHYVKTLDLRELDEPVIAPLDNAAAMHLDLLAAKMLAAGE
jgi:FdhE protein